MHCARVPRAAAAAVAARPTVCRICLSWAEPQVAIYGTYGRQYKLPVKIRVCLPIRLDPQDNSRSRTVCMRCVTKLTRCYDFYCLSLASDRILNEEQRDRRRWEQQEQLKQNIDRKLTAAVDRQEKRCERDSSADGRSVPSMGCVVEPREPLRQRWER